MGVDHRGVADLKAAFDNFQLNSSVALLLGRNGGVFFCQQGGEVRLNGAVDEVLPCLCQLQYAATDIQVNLFVTRDFIPLQQRLAHRNHQIGGIGFNNPPCVA